MTEDNLDNQIDELFPPFTLTPEEFYDKYLAGNKPCILRGYLKSSDWDATQDWIKDGEPNLDFFQQLFPINLEVPVSLCNSKFFNSQECVTEKLNDYVKYWNGAREELKYLKDWHFVSECDKNNIKYKAYTVPEYFKSDWLNEWLDNRRLGVNESRSDYRFVYIGPKGSFTPFHSDVFGSFSWSANVVGVKEWIFLSPGDERKLEMSSGNYVYDVESKQSKELQDKNGCVKLLRVHQRGGDVVFVPSGWFHQVKNLVDTISINHNWFNAANIQKVFSNLNNELERVQKEIEDCSDDPEWNILCQNLLREHFGLNHFQFVDLLTFIYDRRRGPNENNWLWRKEMSTISQLIPCINQLFRKIGLPEENEYYQKLLKVEEVNDVVIDNPR